MHFYKVSKEKAEKDRCEFFFGFKNIAAVFRGKNPRQILSDDSKDYDLIYVWPDGCNSSKDFLSYLLCLHETEQIDLKPGDVIGIKSNNKTICYRFSSSSISSISNIWNCFYEVKKFVRKEKDVRIKCMHRSNKVMDVLAGKEVELSSLNLRKTAIYALDSESYCSQNGDKTDLIITDYSLYKLVDMDVKNVNPYINPFFDFQSAVSYLSYEIQKNSKKGKEALLLLNRAELYLIKDFYQLLALA